MLLRILVDKYLKLLFYRYMDLYEVGLVRFWVKQIIPQAVECFAKRKKESARQVPIHLSDLVSAFLILSIGVGLAILSFVLGLIYAKFKRHSNERIRHRARVL